MATTTPNYGWPVPTSTDFVKDGATAIEALGDAIDATVFGLPSGAILQLISTTKSDTFTMSSSTFADITGLSATITPSSATSKIYVMVALMSGMPSGTATQFLLLRNSGGIGIGDAASSRSRVTSGTYVSSPAEPVPVAFNFLDSPSSTSALTYKVQVRATIGGQQTVINRSNTDTDTATSARGISSITLMEVAG